MKLILLTLVALVVILSTAEASVSYSEGKYDAKGRYN